MKKQLSKLEKRVLSVGAIVLAIPALGSMTKLFKVYGEISGDSIAPTTVGELMEQETATAPEPIKLSEYCHPGYQNLTLDTYNECIHYGMSYVEVANVIGNTGTIMAETASSKIVSWGGTGDVMSHDGTMSATFINNELTAKAQFDLYPDSSR